MPKPLYTFSIPSIHDDLPLDCRIYHPNGVLSNKAAIVAHPYAPLGGSYDDHVVEAITRCFLKAGWIVTTFNFRGAGESKGSTSWTGKPERADYLSICGLMIFYCARLLEQDEIHNNNDSSAAKHTELCISGYSYGSLIASRLPPMQEIQARFEHAERGTAGAEIILRARRLAKETADTTQRGRKLLSPVSPIANRSTASPVVVGGEETDPSERRISRDGRRSVDVVRKTTEVPRRIKAHIRRHSSGSPSKKSSDSTSPSTAQFEKVGIEVIARYLLVSPILPPLSYTLCVPSGEKSNDLFDVASTQKTLVVFGSKDAFTSAKKLRSRVESVSRKPGSKLEWLEIDQAGHFWREDGVLEALQKRIGMWLQS